VEVLLPPLSLNLQLLLRLDPGPLSNLKLPEMFILFGSHRKSH
jgi:hypothetical protein